MNTAKVLFKFTNDSCITEDGYSNTPLLCAANGHLEVVRVLLEGGTNIERGNIFQNTPLHTAAWFGHVEVCRLLLDRGARVNSLNAWKGTPLHSAAEKGYLLVVKLLEEWGADVKLKNEKGQTASDKARSKGKKDVADWLDSLTMVNVR